MYRGEDLGEPATRPGELDPKPPRQRVSQRLRRAVDHTPDEVGRLRDIYYGMVSFVDDEVGRFASVLDGEGIDEDTIIVFMSDHGDYLSDHGMVRKSPAMYDCLIRIPLFIRWPRRIRPVCVDDTMVESIDLAPTLLEFAGVDPLPGAEGRSPAPVLDGRTRLHKQQVFGLYGSRGAPFTAGDIDGVDLAELMAGPRP